MDGDSAKWGGKRRRDGEDSGSSRGRAKDSRSSRGDTRSRRNKDQGRAEWAYVGTSCPNSNETN